MVRYADDFVILCQSVEQAVEQAQTAMAEVARSIKANGLTLGADKTHLGDCRIEGQGFEFLGYQQLTRRAPARHPAEC
ncbi:reverse transcriptase domain-containing protein [Candidatus Accumulibacter aalborgensis]|uniref:reverse transcriptase domain-containing protein n=1 Tax=Candidatus Accumulibacter aalborgensis TaxID=1860102 RepID=UPI000B05D14B